MNEQAQLKTTYLTFDLDESYALEMSCIVEVIPYKIVTPVPETPDYIAGVLNLRGMILPVIDMRARFLKPEKPDCQRRCIIVVAFAELKLGLLVDNVSDLIEVPAEQVTPPPQVGNHYSHVFIKGIGLLEDGVTLIIDTDRLVNLEELRFMDADGELGHLAETGAEKE